ncbi:unnamed protein product [Somion occarium]|uniref:Glycine-rich protein n=1 Tax=Somion occarium TaxID=3059160 RepID=A0ABP1CW87_9APHY
MYVPGLSPLGQRLFPRKGGGGKGGGGGGGGKSGGSSGSKGSSGGSSGASRTPVSVSGKSPKSGSTVSAYGAGGGAISKIPSGQAFAGRSVGGGSRDQVYGSRTYGSGYPSTYSPVGRGVGGLGFPFYFWPVVWGGGLGYGGAYLYNHEFGNSDNPDRPGGPMTVAQINSNSMNSTFHVLSDNTTVAALITAISSNCTIASNSSTAPSVLNSSDPFAPRPEQVVQYYRASSVALTLEGYNDTTALQENSTDPDVPIPSWVDGTLLDCLNQTIGAAVPLVDAATTTAPVTAGTLLHSPALSLLVLVWLSCFFTNLF